MKIWGITGTNGKTTCAWITAEFIRADPSRKCALITTVETDTLSRKLYTGYTTPPLATLKELFAEMRQNGATDCVMEVSSHAIHQRRTGDTVFSGGAFTNLSQDHLDYHRTMEEYFRVKLSFAERIASARWGEGGVAPAHLGRRDFPPYIVCLDGDMGREMFNAVGNLPLNVMGISSTSSKFDLSRLQLKGAYNRSNVLVAAALAESAGISHDIIQSVIPTLKPRWGRLENVSSKSAAQVYVDFAHTPDGLKKVLTAAREFTKGKLWVVFGAGGDRDRAKRPLMGRAASGIADEIVITSDNPRGEEPKAIIEDILSGIENKKPFIECDRRKAIHLALSSAAADDVVLVCGKGHETTQEIAGEKYPFDDREEIRAYAP